MAKSEKQKLKLLYLIKILNEETDLDHGLSIQDIIDRLAVYGIKAERKSLYDDIASLIDFGYDIVSEKEGKMYLYKMAGRNFELAELKLLVDSVQSSKFITEKKSGQLIKKLEALASKYDALLLQRHVFISGRRKNTNETIFYNVDDIYNAINTNKKVSFKYYQWNVKKEKELRKDGKTYLISPFALTWDDDYYYMVGFDSDDNKIKHYRVDKMLKLTITDYDREGTEHFEKFDIADYSNKIFKMFGGEEEAVTLKCHNSIAGVIIDRFGEDVTIVPEDEQYFRARINIALSPQFLGWVFSLGDKICIISPESVVNMMASGLDSVSKLYNKLSKFT